MKAFVPKYTMSYQRHSRIIKQLIADGMHDGKAWKDAAFDRYNELEEAEQNRPAPLPEEAKEAIVALAERDETIRKAYLWASEEVGKRKAAEADLERLRAETPRKEEA